jgi:hypothetical protein
MFLKEGLRVGALLRLQARQPVGIVTQHGIFQADHGKRRLPQAAQVCVLGKAVINPRPFREALDPSGIRQQFQMTGKPWLALTQQAGQILHAQIAMAQQGQQPQTRGLGKGFQGLNAGIKGAVHGNPITKKT